MEKRCGCNLLVQRSFLDLRISARISDMGRPRRASQAGKFMVGKHYWANKDVPEATEYIAAFPTCFWYCLEW
ncbi:hypothetical protein ALC60_08360 [Trachymyrmex zeteki]|uniref:Uncharacterized protein n=1 Tax=Mycetomoellerius zeteki TaxID=64791 RepID=A0A151WX99_9HYME|nr:hypothetical protein ALC60_08360 [Trachymyrmex zeteki]